MDDAAFAPLLDLLRTLAVAPIPPESATPARAFDFRGRLTKLVLSRDVFVLAGTQGPVLLQRCLDAGIVRLAGLQVVLPEQVCGRLPADVQAMLRRRFGSAARDDSAGPRALPMFQLGARGSTGNLPRLALERLCWWIQEHGQRFDGHPARTVPSPLYGVYQQEELVAVSLRLAIRLVARFTQGGDPKPLWDAWGTRGWLRHDPDRFTLRLGVGDQRRRWLGLTWAAWQTATGARSSETTVEASDHETHPAESVGPAPEAERHVGRDTPSGSG